MYATYKNAISKRRVLDNGNIIEMGKVTATVILYRGVTLNDKQSKQCQKE